MRNLQRKKNRGITLVALVVTIVILIILATISINALFGDEGIIKQADRSKAMTANGEKYEEEKFQELDDKIANSLAEPPAPPTPGEEVEKPSDWTSDKVKPIEDGSGNAIPLPDGFYYVGGDRDTGLVISDNSSDENKGTSYETASTLQGNQFVWIPVDSESDFERTHFDSNGQPKNSLSASWKEPYAGGYSDGNGTQEKAEFETMKTQVLKYGGFYIGRYEAGDGTNGTTLRTAETTAHSVVCKKGVAPYNWIPWGKSLSDPGELDGKSGAVYLSKNVYTGKVQEESVVSTLCYGSQWDAMCRYIGDSQRTTPTKSAAELTGSVSTDVSKNIYDLAGNCWEWTMEASDTKYRVHRGGGFYRFYSVSYRDFSFPTVDTDLFSFRFGLYVKD